MEAFNVATREMAVAVRDNYPTQNKTATPRNFPQTVIQGVHFMKNVSIIIS